MDSLTQLTLGAAVGEAVLGRKVGNKAIIWGAVAGTLPDLDVLAYPFWDVVEQFTYHRGVSHALFFLLLTTPVLGYLIHRFHKRAGASPKDWTWLVFWAFMTHIILDSFTNYGTQVFLPFSNYPVAFSTIFIIDPLYTLPLLVGVISVLFMARTSGKRRVVNWLGIALSTFYLGLTGVNKVYINHVFASAVQEQNIAHTRIMTVPTALNNILWRAVVMDENGYYEGFYSLLDDDRDIAFEYTPVEYHLLDPIREEWPVERLIWFSRGFYRVEKNESEVIITDLRFGQNGMYVFQFNVGQIEKNTGLLVLRNQVMQKEMKTPDPKLWQQFGQRLLGQYEAR